MKKSYVLLALVATLYISCKKDPPISYSNPISFNIPIDTDFVFYPKRNAYWIMKSSFDTPNGTFNCLDTFYLGIDTTLFTHTVHNDSPTNSYIDSASFKVYKEVMILSMSVSPTLDTFYSLPRRYGWFRADDETKKIFTPELINSEYYEYLEADFSLKINDTVYIANTQYPLIVNCVDSLEFGDKYLKYIRWGQPMTTNYSGEIIQGVNLYSYNLTNFGNLHPIHQMYWKKFIYKTDTLLKTF